MWRGVSNKHLYQEFSRIRRVRRHASLLTLDLIHTPRHKHISRTQCASRGGWKTQPARPLTRIPQSHNSNLCWPFSCWSFVLGVRLFLPVRKWDNQSLFKEKELTRPGPWHVSLLAPLSLNPAASAAHRAAFCTKTAWYQTVSGWRSRRCSSEVQIECETLWTTTL